MNGQRLSWNTIISLFLCAAFIGAMGCSNVSYLTRNVKGPFFKDPLKGDSSIAVVENGLFTKSGWQPGEDGQLIYDLSIMPQGMISLDVTGLNRTASDSAFLTLFEVTNSKYAEPFISKNPYKIELSLNNNVTNPESPFNFLWTMKDFPEGTNLDDRYVDGIPDGVRGYENMMASAPMPIFPDQTYRIQIKWKSGKAQLLVNGELLAEHDFEPLIFNAAKLKLVIGKSPCDNSFDLSDITISNVWVSFPSIYQG